MKHWGKILIGLAVTVGFLWWTLRGVDVREVGEAILEGDPVLLFAAIAVATFGFVIRAMRWRVLLAPVAPGTTLRARFAAVSIHFMANNVIPLRVGEFARAWVFSRMERVSASAAFGTVVVERFMDGVVLLVFLVVPVFTPGFPDVEALSTGGGSLLFRAAILGVLGVLVALLAMAVFPRVVVRATEVITRLLPPRTREPLLAALGAFLDSLAIIRDPKVLVLGFAWSFFFWAFHASSFWLGMRAFGIETGYVSALFTSSVVGFWVALPSAPGFIGTFHFAANFALTEVYGAAESQSLAFAFGYHFAGWVPITTIGLIYAWRMGISLGDVGASEELVEGDLVSAGGAGPVDDAGEHDPADPSGGPDTGRR